MKSIKRKRRLIGRKNLLRRITYLYRLIIVNEDEQRVVMGLRMSHLIFWTMLLAVAVLGAWGGIAIFKKTPTLTGSVEERRMTRMSIMEQAFRLDSLERVVALQDQYIESVHNIIEGSVRVDTVYSVDSLTRVRSSQLMEATQRETEFARQFEETERFNISGQPSAIGAISGLSMFRPVAGLVTRHFDAQARHYGVDIAVNPSENVVAAMDGTVLMSDYTAGSGYTVCIVHPGQLITVYRNCEQILRKAGDKVSQGESIALAGLGSDALPKGSQLHFELWYLGQPLDPEKYISLQ